jgi:hypothetical protein
MAATNDRTSSRQRGRRTQIKPQQSLSNKILVLGPRWGLTPGLTGLLTVRRNVTLTLLRQWSYFGVRRLGVCLQAVSLRKEVMGPGEEFMGRAVSLEAAVGGPSLGTNSLRKYQRKPEVRGWREVVASL